MILPRSSTCCIVLPMKNTGNIEFKPDLGYTPFHLGCNALVVHPNCGLCTPAHERLNYRPERA